MNQLLRALNPKLYDMIQAYRATEDQMPWAYQVANPQGRPLHNDWGIMSSDPNSLLSRIQPFQRIPRRDCAYRLPLPFKQTSGKTSKQWMLWDSSYPLSPGTPVEYRDYTTSVGTFVLAHALVDCAGPGWATFAAFINGEWVECFKQYHDVWFGKRLSYYNGLKQDLTVSPPQTLNGKIKSDLMCWFPEVSASWVTEI